MDDGNNDMSTAVYPPLTPDRQREEEAASLRRELDWLLASLQHTLIAIRDGLHACAALLTADEPGSTLVLSTPRSDHVKGFVTRRGHQIVRADIQVRMHGLPAATRGRPGYRLALSRPDPSTSLKVKPLISVGQRIDQALDIVDVSRYTGDPKDAPFVAGQLRLLLESIREAGMFLRGGSFAQTSWSDDPVDPRLFDPPLPEHLSFHLTIAEAALRLELRTVEPSAGPDVGRSTVAFRDRLAVALGAAKKVEHDEVNDVFIFRGQSVRVREKVVVESQDPSLMAAMAKLAGLEHHVAAAQRSLATVMDEELDDGM